MEKEVTKGTSEGNEVSKTEEYEKGKLRFASSKYDTIRISVDETNWKKKKKKGTEREEPCTERRKTEKRGRPDKNEKSTEKKRKNRRGRMQTLFAKVQERRRQTEEAGHKHCVCRSIGKKRTNTRGLNSMCWEKHVQPNTCF